jgi:hypothetical protein
VFQIVTGENWSSYMYNLMDVGLPLAAALYTIMIVIVGSLFLMNLILAVIITAFIQITEKEIKQEKQKKSKRLDTWEMKNEDQASEIL